MNIEWHGPLPGTNYTGGRLTPITIVCFHHMDGTIQGADATFKNPLRRVSAHYGIPYYDDLTIWNWVAETDTAYAQGGTETDPADDELINHRCVCVEVEDLGRDKPGWTPFPFTDSQYARCAYIARKVSQEQGFVLIRQQSLIGHNEVAGVATYCPGTLDLGRIQREAIGMTPDQMQELKDYITAERNVTIEATADMIRRAMRGQKVAVGFGSEPEIEPNEKVFQTEAVS